MTRRTEIAIIVAIVGAFLLGAGAQHVAVLSQLCVVLIALLMIITYAIATPRKSKSKPDPDAAWREAADEQ